MSAEELAKMPKDQLPASFKKQVSTPYIQKVEPRPTVAPVQATKVEEKRVLSIPVDNRRPEPTNNFGRAMGYLEEALDRAIHTAISDNINNPKRVRDLLNVLMKHKDELATELATILTEKK